MRKPKHLAILAAAATITVAVAACTTSPTGRSQLVLVSDDQIQAMGAQAFEQMKAEARVASNTPQSRYVDCVARALIAVTAPDRNWEVRTFEDDAVNAFALPGGKIGVYTGLLGVAENQHQLAAVVGHEIAHVLANHSAARVSSQLATQLGVSVLSGVTGMSPQVIGMGAQLLVTMPYGRGDETESDILGLQYMARAGFDPAEASKLWQNMARAGGGGPPEFMSTHPSPDSRIRELNARQAEVMPIYRQARAAGRTPNCRRP